MGHHLRTEQQTFFFFYQSTGVVHADSAENKAARNVLHVDLGFKRRGRSSGPDVSK